MSYGYIGDTSTSIKQQVKNAGVLSMNDVLDLKGKGQLGGSLELIITSTASSSTIDFVDKFLGYDVHLIELINCTPSTEATFGIKFSNDSGSSYETTNYEYGNQRGFVNGTFEERKSTSEASIRLGGNVETSDNFNGYFYIYNANDSSKYTFITQHSSFTAPSGGGGFGFEFGGGVYAQAETINGIRIGQTSSASAFTSGTAKLYGVKQI